MDAKRCDTGRSCRRLRRDDGAALVEMAFVLPILGMFLFGIIVFGYLLSFKQDLTQAAAEGARAAVGIPANSLAPAPCVVSPAPTDPRIYAAQCAVNESAGSFNKSCNTGNGLACTFVVHDCNGALQTGATPDCLTVTLSYANSGSTRLMPAIPLIDLAMPSTLTADSTSQLTPVG